jgi:hypothetical protein
LHPGVGDAVEGQSQMRGDLEGFVPAAILRDALASLGLLRMRSVPASGEVRAQLRMRSVPCSDEVRGFEFHPSDQIGFVESGVSLTPESFQVRSWLRNGVARMRLPVA